MQCCTRKPFWVAKPEPQICSASAFPYFEANAELGVVFNFLVMETGIDESLNLVRKIESRRRNFSQSRKIILYLGPVKMVFLDELSISLPLLETRDKNFTFLFLLSKFEIRISYFSFYSRNSRPEFQISLSTLEIRDQNFKFLFLLSNLLFLTLVNACFICFINLPET